MRTRQREFACRTLHTLKSGIRNWKLEMQKLVGADGQALAALSNEMKRFVGAATDRSAFVDRHPIAAIMFAAVETGIGPAQQLFG